jgi:hypothetical protein
MAACTGASGRTGTKYTYAQLEGLWINAGGSKTLAPVMAAVAEAESGGCSTAYNSGSPASGLWQIEPINSQYVPGGYGNVFNPADNAKAAVNVYGAQGLRAWSTYTSGAYKQFMNAGTTPDTNVPGTAATTSAPTSTANPSSCVILVPNPVSGVPIIGDLVSANGICLFTTTEARALIGGLILSAGGVTCAVGIAILVVSGFARTGAGKAAGRAVGGVAEAAGGAAALAGFPEAGAAAAAAGSAVRKHSQSGPTPAGRYATRKGKAAKAETAELNAKGASDISTANRAKQASPRPRPPVSPGRKSGSVAGPGRKVAGTRARSASKPATQAEAGF